MSATQWPWWPLLPAGYSIGALAWTRRLLLIRTESSVQTMLVGTLDLRGDTQSALIGTFQFKVAWLKQGDWLIVIDLIDLNWLVTLTHWVNTLSLVPYDWADCPDCCWFKGLDSSRVIVIGLWLNAIGWLDCFDWCERGLIELPWLNPRVTPQCCFLDIIRIPCAIVNCSVIPSMGNHHGLHTCRQL